MSLHEFQPTRQTVGELEGFTEAQAGPGSHACGGVILDATISQERLILVCYTCSTYWHTGLLDSKPVARPAMLRAAEALYAKPKAIRRQILRDAYRRETEKMVRLYGRGEGCLRIGNRFGVSSNAVWDRLRRAGVQLRPRYKRLLPKLEFNGNSYTWSAKGYYRRTTGARPPLQHDVWEFYRGPVPDGYVIWLMGGDPATTDPAQLKCMTLAEMTAMLNPRQPVPDKACLWCGAPMKPHEYDRRRGHAGRGLYVSIGLGFFAIFRGY